MEEIFRILYYFPISGPNLALCLLLALTRIQDFLTDYIEQFELEDQIENEQEKVNDTLNSEEVVDDDLSLAHVQNEESVEEKLDVIEEK